MLSACPKCKQKVEHEDYMFEVICSCGTRFNPFMGEHDDPLLQGLTPMTDTSGSPPATEAAQDFSESLAAFNEIRDFGRGIETEEGSKKTNLKQPEKTQAPEAPPTSELVEAVAALSQQMPETNCWVTAGDAISGYQVESFFEPASVCAELDLASPDPLKPAFQLLMEQAARVGANAVLACRWSVIANGEKVLLSGSPAKIHKADTP